MYLMCVKLTRCAVTRQRMKELRQMDKLQIRPFAIVIFSVHNCVVVEEILQFSAFLLSYYFLPTLYSNIVSQLNDAVKREM